MALRTKTRERLYEMHQYRGGRIENLALRGFFHTVEKVQGHQVSIPDLQISFVSAQTSTPANVDASGTGRLYFIWALSGTLSAAGTSASNAAIVQVLDNSVVIASAKGTANNALEAYFYDSTDGVGIPYSTNLQVAAVAAADGTSNPAAADRPDVVVVWGDDAINTDDANLINVNFG